MFAYNVCMKILFFGCKDCWHQSYHSSCYSSYSKGFLKIWSQLVTIGTECLPTMSAWKSSFFLGKGSWYQFFHHLVHVLKVFQQCGLNLLLSEHYVHENLPFVGKGCWHQFYHHLFTVHVQKVFQHHGLNLLLSELNVCSQYLHENLPFMFVFYTNIFIIFLQLPLIQIFYRWPLSWALKLYFRSYYTLNDFIRNFRMSPTLLERI